MRTGPMIEGVVSPTASKTTINNALKGAATPGTYVDQNVYRDAGGFDSISAPTMTGISGNNTIFGAPPPAPLASGLQPTASTTTPAGANWNIVGGYYVDPNTGLAHSRAPGGTSTTTTTPTGGGGGGGGSTPPPAPPGTPTEEGTTPGGSGSLGDISREAIDAQINALTAQYGLDLASIAALGGEIGAQAKFLMAQINRDQGFAQEDLISNMVQRGIFRSGVTARDTGRLMGDFAQQRARVEMDKGSRLRQLAERAGAASAAMGRGKADVIAQIDQGNLGAELRQTLLNELNSLTPADIQNALNAAYSGNQESLTQLMQKGSGAGGWDPNGAQTQQVVGGYAIDPNTGLAGEYVGGGAGATQPTSTQALPSAGTPIPGMGGAGYASPANALAPQMFQEQPIAPYMPTIGTNDSPLTSLTPEQLALLMQRYDGDMGMNPRNTTNSLTRGGVSGI